MSFVILRIIKRKCSPCYRARCKNKKNIRSVHSTGCVKGATTCLHKDNPLQFKHSGAAFNISSMEETAFSSLNGYEKDLSPILNGS